METITVHQRWTGPDTGPFAAWVADRASADPTHCVRVDAVGRDPSGRLVVCAESLRGTRLPDALDRIGVPTVGVAVTLTVPLIELAAQARSGAIVLGDARADDVLVDDAGLTVLVDHPPDADVDGHGVDRYGLGQRDADASARDARTRCGPSGGRGRPRQASTSSAALSASAAPSAASRSSQAPGATALLFAVRAVWERVDPREPCRAAIDRAVAEAVDGADADVLRLLEVVRATGPPRPVRWDPPRDDFVFVAPQEPASPGLAGVLRQFVEDGVRVGGAVRVPMRRLLVGAVVLAGVVAAGVFALRGPG
ncbi:hypothetical protein DEJ13_08125 [Curtobacterium sp. MCLR17_007]|uniref:hypothetical protein n=1 Tax=Curtobacterium sp. MCLR17_007 TaxID=2175648 RepID=UPI0011B35DDB|nr:hypothetical protein [Curtobacterium sp. MCLR17_007]WIB61784.1 hypothetical protein DEJ13_08125 [Curtobacterium sp. MCLR17_007]